jgi:hypothetical protein
LEPVAHLREGVPDELLIELTKVMHARSDQPCSS